VNAPASTPMTVQRAQSRARRACSVDVARRLLIHAADLIEDEAKCLSEAHTINGAWTPLDDADREALALFHDFRRTAISLRTMARANVFRAPGKQEEAML